MAQRDSPDNDHLASLVNELQNVLTVIRGHAQIIQRRLNRGELPTAERLSARMGIIDEATRRMAQTVGRLPELTRRQAPGDESVKSNPPPEND